MAIWPCCTAASCPQCWQCTPHCQPEKPLAMPHFHAVVWIDHSEAHVIHFSPDDVEQFVVRPNHPHHKVHSTAGTLGDGKAPVDKDFFHRVAEILQNFKTLHAIGQAHPRARSGFGTQADRRGNRGPPDRCAAGGLRSQVLSGQRPHALTRAAHNPHTPAGSCVISRCSMVPVYGCARATSSSSSTPRPGAVGGMM